MRTFIFGIGGTGSRVMRSLTMLLAAGAGGEGTSPKDLIIPILIDYDLDNHDTKEVRQILSSYDNIHNFVFSQKELTGNSDENKNNSSSHCFFSGNVKKLRELEEGANIDQRADYQLYLEEADTNITFARHINFLQLNAANGLTETSDLLKVLYDDSPENDPCAELYLKLDKGFKGCPNIGCVVTKSLTKSRELRTFVGMLNPNDRVVIIGSIFGGTGASGIPMLLDLIKSGNRIDVPVAVIAVTPYFNVSKDDSSAIDSYTFMAKTKAALDAYNLGKSVNRQTTFIYYVGDNNKCGEYANNEGGVGQNNPAHVVELAAAMMALDFMNVNMEQQDNRKHVNLAITAQPREMGLLPLKEQNAMDSELRINRFYKDETLVPYIYPLMRFMIFCHFTKNYIIPGKLEKKDVAIANSGLKDDNSFKTELDKVIDYFYAWVKEIQKGSTKRALKLFADPTVASYDNLFADIRTMKKGRVFDDHYLKETAIRDALNKAWEAKKSTPNMTPAHFFIESMSSITEDLLQSLFKQQ